jgi:hypothetical protein
LLDVIWCTSGSAGPGPQADEPPTNDSDGGKGGLAGSRPHFFFGDGSGWQLSRSANLFLEVIRCTNGSSSTGTQQVEAAGNISGGGTGECTNKAAGMGSIEVGIGQSPSQLTSLWVVGLANAAAARKPLATEGAGARTSWAEVADEDEGRVLDADAATVASATPGGADEEVAELPESFDILGPTGFAKSGGPMPPQLADTDGRSSRLSS